MIILYIIISLLFGILVALNCIRADYNILGIIVLGIVSILLWPIYILAAIIIEIIHLIKDRKGVKSEDEGVVLTADDLKDMINEEKNEQ